MADWTSTLPTVLAAFMASLVEFVEALTIVLAVGTVRGWRAALTGTAAGLALLVALVAALGPALTRVPIGWVQLVVGGLLLLFGLRWLRKAVLRSAGVLPLHDEALAFASEAQALRVQGAGPLRGLDMKGFATAFKIVVLEGLEVVFIVIAVGAHGALLLPATVGAALALLLVAVLGLWLHQPLARVPENALKFGVGVLLSAFGCFWVGEGIGLEWPGADWSVLGLCGGFLLLALGLVAGCRRLARLPARSSAQPLVATSKRAHSAAAKPRFWQVALQELWGLFVDDGLLAAGALLWVLAAWAMTEQLHPAVAGMAAFLAAGLALALTASTLLRAAAARQD